MIRAMLQSAWASLRFEGARGAWHKVTGGIRGQLALVTGPWATGSVRDARMRVCRGCDLFDTKLETCGDMRNPVPWFNHETGRNELIGCGCHMPTKTKLEHATCWRRDMDLAGGWPDGL